MTEETISGERLHRLRHYLAGQGLPLSGVAPVRLSGGLANINYRIELESGPAVLRRPPDGDLPPGAHDMAREHRILSRLPDRFPLAPRSRHLCNDPTILGVPFQIVEFRDGIAIRGDALLPQGQDGDLPQRLAASVVDTMAALHRIDAAAVGLSDLGKPVGFLTRAAAGWVKRARAVDSGVGRLGMATDVLEAWLATGLASIPMRAPVLLHCDIKLDNMLLDRDTMTPVALLDWDMGTRGDPAFDLGTLLSYWTEPGDPDCRIRLGQMPTAQPGFPGRAWAIERYCAATGFDPAGLRAVEVLCLFKLGVVFLQLHRRWIDGALGDERYRKFEDLGLELVDAAWEMTT